VKLKADGTWARIAPEIPLRHPSQLYEALLEGVLIGVILWTVYWSANRGLPDTEHRAPRTGLIAALFLLLYAVARFLVEFTRQPDAQLGFVVGPFSMGQILSVGVIVGGGLIYYWPRRASANVAPL
jgi:phosphatidylglycerol:prolipoprotein diacylglycerol transferase